MRLEMLNSVDKLWYGEGVTLSESSKKKKKEKTRVDCLLY